MAGLPKIVVPALTFFITTLPNNILALLPILTFSPITTLAPKKTSLPTFALLRIDVLEPKREYDPNFTLCAIIPECVIMQKFSILDLEQTTENG